MAVKIYWVGGRGGGGESLWRCKNVEIEENNREKVTASKR